MNLCECGCNREVKNRFVSGHNFKVNPTILFGEKNGFYGKTHTEDSKKKCSAPHIGRKQSNGERKKRSESGKKRWAEDPKRKKSQICECGCRDVTLPGRKFITGHNRRGCGTNNHAGKVIHTEEWNRNISDGHIGFIFRKNPKNVTKEYFDNIVRKILKLSGKHPNGMESFLDKRIQDRISNEYTYSGNGKVIIEGKCPDWINVNGKKKVIELFGDYWHGEKKTGRTKEQEEELRKAHYAKYGFDCLIIWSPELKNPERVIEKIKNFTYGGIQC